MSLVAKGARCFASIHGQLADIRTKVPLHKLPVHLNSPPGIVTILLHVVLLSDTLFHPLDGRPPSCELALPFLCAPSSDRTRSSPDLLCPRLFKFAPKKITEIVMKISYRAVAQSSFHPLTDELVYPETCELVCLVDILE